MKQKTLIISIISILLSLLGISRELYLLLDNYGLFQINYIVYRITPAIDLRFFSNLLTVEFESLFINFSDLFVYVLLFMGSIIFLISNGKRKNILMFSLSILLLVIIMIIIPIHVFNVVHKSHAMVNYNNIVLQSIVWVIIIGIMLRHLSKKSKNEDYQIESNGSVMIVPRYFRLIHFIFDSIIITLIFHQYCIIDFEYISLLFYFLLYYIFYESIFQATPMKYLTGTFVKSIDETEFVFSKVLIRSIVRLIPFEPISFLIYKVGWHDKWSKTIVTKG